MKPPSKRQIFKNNTSEAPDYVGQLVRFFWRTSWNLFAKNEEDRSTTTPYSVVWTDEDDRTAVRYVEDFIVGFPYLVIEGRDIDKTITWLDTKFNFYTEKEIFQWVKTANSVPEAIEAVLRLGVASPQQFEREFFEVYQYVFEHPEPTVRSVGFQAWQYCGWREIMPIVERMKTSDPNEQIRTEAEDTLKAYEISLTYDQLSHEEQKGSLQLQLKLDSDKQKLTELRTQLKKVEERIDFARRTNIFGRPQSGENERERDKLTQEIKDSKHRIAENESAIEALEE